MQDNRNPVELNEESSQVRADNVNAESKAQNVPMIQNTWEPLKICKLIDAQVVNMKKGNETSQDQLESADLKLTFSLPSQVDPADLAHQLLQNFSISTIQTEVIIGCIGTHNREGEAGVYTIDVPLFRGNKERAILDRFHSQEKIIQHHCFTIESMNYTYRIRTHIDFDKQEIATPEISTSMFDCRRINDVRSNTYLSLVQIKNKTKEMFVACNERRKKGKAHHYSSLPVATSTDVNHTPMLNFYPIPTQVTVQSVSTN